MSAADKLDAHLAGMLVGRTAAVQSATTRARRFLVSVQRSDGSADNYQRQGGNACDHIQEASEAAGLGVVVRVLPIDDDYLEQSPETRFLPARRMNAPRIPRSRPPVFNVMHSLCLRLLGIGLAGLLLALVSALSGCGGSDEQPDDRRDTQPVDCQTYPERCK